MTHTVGRRQFLIQYFPSEKSVIMFSSRGCTALVLLLGNHVQNIKKRIDLFYFAIKTF